MFLTVRVTTRTCRVVLNGTHGAATRGRRHSSSARMSDIDWKTELRKIEREFDGLPPEPSPAEIRARRAAEQRTERRRKERAVRLGVQARLVLVVVLAGAIGLWPYPRDCGRGLFAFMGAEAMIVAGGLWVVAWTWRSRMAKTHGVALVLVLWGLMLIGHQVLPRIGYAKTDAGNPARWWCVASASR